MNSTEPRPLHFLLALGLLTLYLSYFTDVSVLIKKFSFGKKIGHKYFAEYMYEYVNVNVVMCMYTYFYFAGICVCLFSCYTEHASHGVRTCRHLSFFITLLNVCQLYLLYCIILVSQLSNS